MFFNEGSKLLDGNSSDKYLRIYPIEHGNKLSLIVINTSDKKDITAEINLDKKVGNVVSDYELTKVGAEVKRKVVKPVSKYTRQFKKHTLTCLEFN